MFRSWKADARRWLVLRPVLVVRARYTCASKLSEEKPPGGIAWANVGAVGGGKPEVPRGPEGQPVKRHMGKAVDAGNPRHFWDNI